MTTPHEEHAATVPVYFAKLPGKVFTEAPFRQVARDIVVVPADSILRGERDEPIEAFPITRAQRASIGERSGTPQCDVRWSLGFRRSSPVRAQAFYRQSPLRPFSILHHRIMARGPAMERQ